VGGATIETLNIFHGKKSPTLLVSGEGRYESRQGSASSNPAKQVAKYPIEVFMRVKALTACVASNSATQALPLGLYNRTPRSLKLTKQVVNNYIENQLV